MPLSQDVRIVASANAGSPKRITPRRSLTGSANRAALILVLGTLTSVCAPKQICAQTTESAERGREIYDRRCSGCHALDRDDEGPRLRSVFGRQAGSIPGFKYSAALKASKLIWDQASLDKWLANPDDLIPGNSMAYHVSDAAQRGALLEYLRSIAPK